MKPERPLDAHVNPSHRGGGSDWPPRGPDGAGPRWDSAGDTWVDALRHRDPGAQAKLYRAFKDTIFTTVVRIVRDAALAEDLTHDTMIRAMERIDHYRSEAPLEHWIRRIAVRLALQHLRKRSRRRNLLRRMTDGPSLPVFSRPASLDGIQLERAIQALPESLRVVFLLHAVEGFRHAEIADELGITETASRTRLRRARAALVRMWDPEPERSS